MAGIRGVGPAIQQQSEPAGKGQHPPFASRPSPARSPLHFTARIGSPQGQRSPRSLSAAADRAHCRFSVKGWPDAESRAGSCR